MTLEVLPRIGWLYREGGLLVFCVEGTARGEHDRVQREHHRVVSSPVADVERWRTKTGQYKTQKLNSKIHTVLW